MTPRQEWSGWRAAELDKSQNGHRYPDRAKLTRQGVSQCRSKFTPLIDNYNINQIYLTKSKYYLLFM